MIGEKNHQDKEPREGRWLMFYIFILIVLKLIHTFFA